MANRNAEVAGQLDQYSEQFQPGESGLLALDFDRAARPGDLHWLVATTEGRACHYLGWRLDGERATIKFQTLPQEGIGAIPLLGLIVLALGSIPVGILGWKLYKTPTPDVLTAITQVAVPLGVVAIGGILSYVSLGRPQPNIPGSLAGLGILGAGTYLAWQSLKPEEPPPAEEITTQGLPTLQAFSQ